MEEKRRQAGTGQLDAVVALTALLLCSPPLSSAVRRLACLALSPRASLIDCLATAAHT